MKQIKVTNSITTRDSRSFQIYLNNIDKISNPITAEEERYWVDMYRNPETNEKDREKAKETLILANLRFVVSVAKYYYPSTKHLGVKMADLVNEGNIGLIKAVERYDPNRGARLISYAVWLIRLTIREHLNGCARGWTISGKAKELAAPIQRFVLSYFNENQHEPSEQMIAEHFNIDVERFRSISKQLGRVQSIEDQIQGTDGLKLGDIIECPDELGYSLDKSDTARVLRELVANMPKRQRIIIEGYFGFNGEPMTLKDLSQKLGYSRERIRQIKFKALKQLKKTIKVDCIEL